MFNSVYNRGFKMTFENGITISVQWGEGNYCEREGWQTDLMADCKKSQTKSTDAEVAIWDDCGNWITKEAFSEVYGKDLDDEVEGYLTTDQIAELIQWAKSRKSCMVGVFCEQQTGD